MTRRALFHLVAALIGLVLLAACAPGRPDQSGAPRTPDSAAEVFGHVHGLGMDPADGTVYVATHKGLFRITTAGRLEQVGVSRPDLMGFTVAGPRTFISSGHPAPDDTAPNPLGVVRSVDAGGSWETLALAGEVDMHALDANTSTLYGYDATQGLLRASTDGGRNWQNRDSLEALDIAVRPDDPNTVLATTASGVATSRDGGVDFASGTGPMLAYLSWPQPDALYGVTPDGLVQRSTDMGITWTAGTTSPGGRPQALTAIDANRLLVATASGVYESRDGGRTFASLVGTGP